MNLEDVEEIYKKEVVEADRAFSEKLKIDPRKKGIDQDYKRVLSKSREKYDRAVKKILSKGYVLKKDAKKEEQDLDKNNKSESAGFFSNLKDSFVTKVKVYNFKIKFKLKSIFDRLLPSKIYYYYFKLKIMFKLLKIRAERIEQKIKNFLNRTLEKIKSYWQKLISTLKKLWEKIKPKKAEKKEDKGAKKDVKEDKAQTKS